ncbi:replicative DNA helicase [Alcaligenaceae bacterium SJ-26]|nr:replicative DNA helicase [Alcaligenaceae bacterium SJ-26]
MTEIIANIDAEQSVLGALLIDNDAFDRLPALETRHFYRGDHRAIYAEIVALLQASQPVDVLTLHDRMQVKHSGAVDMEYLHALVSSTPSSANISKYAEMVIERSQRRDVADLAAQAQEAAAGSESTTPALIDRLASGLERITEAAVRTEPVLVADDLVSYVEELELRAEGQGPKAIPTGFPDLDKRLMGGIRRGELVIVAARPKMGKSAFAFNVALNVSKDYSALILSMEMPKAQIHDRNVACMSQIPLGTIMDPRSMTSDEFGKLFSAVERLRGLNLSIDDQGGLSLLDVKTKARQVKRRHGLDLLVIDYLQLMEGDDASRSNRNNQIEQITRGLKAMAKEMDIGIVLLSQLNRELERRPNKRPMASDLRDSGAIEQDCDIALFLYRDEIYNPDSMDKGICEVNVGLIRQGEPGTVPLVYQGQYTRFRSMEPGREYGRPQQPRKPKYSGLKD